MPKPNRLKSPLLIGAAALLVLSAVVVLVLFISEREREVDYQINGPDITEVFIQNGTTGEQVFCTMPSEIKEITDYFAAFRYRKSEKLPPGIFDGWSYRIAMMIDNQQHSYLFGSDWVEIDKVRYYSDDAYFQRYIDLFEE